MLKSPTLKLLLGALIFTLAAGAAFVAFAQEEESTAVGACEGRHRHAYDEYPLKALAELDMTIAELRDHLASGGTIAELLVDTDLQADLKATRLACINELETNGDLTAEQAAALRAVIETGAREAMREAIGGREWGKGDHSSWRQWRGHDGRGDRPRFEMRRSRGGRGMPDLPNLFRGMPFGSLEELLEEIEVSGSTVIMEEALRERLEEMQEALRSGSGSRGFFGFRIDRDEDGNWHLDWFGEDDDESDGDTSDDAEEDPSEESEESEDPDASANNSA